MPEIIKSAQNNDEKNKKNARKTKKSKKKINEAIATMYGDKPLKAKTEYKIDKSNKKSKSAILVICLLVLGFFVSLSWLGFYFLGGGNTFNDKNIRISIDTPSSITSGDEIEFIIHYKNEQKLQLSNAELRVKPPSGFILSKAEPISNGTNEYHYKLGTLDINDGGKIIFNGKFIGQKSGNHEITTYLAYRPLNFNADFEKIASASLKITESPLSLFATAPDETAAGAQTEFEISLTNDSNNELGPIKIIATIPDLFDVSDLKTDDNNIEFIIETLEPKKEWRQKINGSFKNSAPPGEYMFKIKGYIIIDNKDYLQNEIEHYVNVESAQLEVLLSVDDFEKKGSVAPGKSFNTRVEVKNNSETKLSDVQLILEIETPSQNGKSIVDWKKLKKERSLNLNTEELSNNRTRATIIWNQENTTELAELKENASNTQSITIPIMTQKEFGGILPGNSIIIVAKTNSRGGSIMQTAPFEITLRSDTEINANTGPAGDPLVGIGPDGLTEVSVRPHNLSFTIQNSLHEILDIEVLLELPENTAFEKAVEVPAGDLQFIKSKRAVRWTLNKLPLSVPSLTISMRLDTITPVGDPETETLVNEIILTATDALSNNPFVIKKGQVKRK